MRRTLIVVGAMLSLAWTSACASSGAGASREAMFTRDLGRLLESFMDEAVRKVYNKHGIPLFRTENQYRAIIIESEWMPRAVQSEEQAAGVVAARNQIILRGRRVEEDLAVPGQGVFRYTFELRNQVRTEAVDAWHPAPMPDVVEQEYRTGVLSDLEMEVRSGVRR
jgi:hypothetical protein